MTSRKTRGTTAFTLIEVVVALAILAIALVTLLRLQVVNIRMAGRAERMSQAALLADAKLAELLAGGFPEIGSRSGAVSDEDSEVVLRWRTTVRERRLDEVERVAVTGLRDVSVDVAWNEGEGQERVRMSTCVAQRSDR